MLVDDVDHVRAMLRSMLELDGFEVVADAADGPAALDVVADADPDVVIVDHMMPGMDGLELAQALRERRPEQVIVLYTAFRDPEVDERAARIGIDLCIGKTEGIESLEREIARLADALS